ncbi:MAG TPA: hypothetical protein IAB98_04670 [Candidatus Egerieimonas intestinavium]|uniref:Uncharacterized protein n=1 Tax=Candidatus Egerieimonas intestinavium TaxID=2840777 RepID=A0A9D1JFG5_9FIRM|nr:hypothetical protein [Candidatus Egerieimonas intestinavium]
MRIDISGGKRWNNWAKRQLAKVVLYFLYGGIYELYKRDGRVRKEILGWPDGMTYCLSCGPQGPRLFFRKTGKQLQRLNPRVQRYYDTCITFKSLEDAILVLTGRMGIAGAYAAHAFTLHGDIGTAMELTRCVDVVESYLFPRVMTKRILRQVARKEFSALRLYLWILVGMVRGAYTESREEKKPFRIKSMHRKFEEEQQ